MGITKIIIKDSELNLPSFIESIVDCGNNQPFIRLVHLCTADTACPEQVPFGEDTYCTKDLKNTYLH